MHTERQHLERTLTLRGAVTLNLLDMIGVGPFITLPLLIGAMGGPQAMVGWVLGAVLAACDGMVWAELGAAMPEAGGTYAYLHEMYPGRVGRWLSFLFAFQLLLSAPLSVASGCIGVAMYAGAVVAGLAGHAVWVAVASVVVAVALQYRRLSGVKRVAAGAAGGGAGDDCVDGGDGRVARRMGARGGGAEWGVSSGCGIFCGAGERDAVGDV